MSWSEFDRTMKRILKNIFINGELNYLRSGWRIGIFLLIALGCNTLITAPVVALLQSTIPAMSKQTVAAYVFYAVTTLATWLMLRFIDRRPFISVGLPINRSAGKELSQGLLLGSGMMSIIFVIEYTTGMVSIEFREITLQQGMVVFLNSAALYLVVGYGEEMMFRGYLFQTFVEGSNKIIATLTISFLFALAHSKNPNVSIFGLINVGLAGIWLSVAYFKTKALWVPTGMHISWNFFQGFVYSYPVSGTTSENEQLGKAIVQGPEWITGGTFGPEGGALATLMLVIGTYIIYQWKWISPSDRAWRYETWRDERKQLNAYVEFQEIVPQQDINTESSSEAK